MIIQFLVITLAVAAGQILANAYMRLYLTLKRQKCQECGKKFRTRINGVQFMSSLCQECLEKAREKCAPPQFGFSVTEMVKDIAADPEAVKAIRKAYGIQSEREMFEEEAERDSLV